MLQRRRNCIISFVTSIIVFTNFMLHRNEVHNIFVLSEESFFLYKTLRFLSVIFAWIIVFKIEKEIECLIVGNKTQRNRALFFFSYFILNALVLVLVWPGIFKGDEFYMVPELMNMNIVWIQSWITSVFYITALMILPYLFSITLIQVFIISELASYIFMDVYQVLKRKKLAYFLMVPFVLFPVLDNNQFSLRSSLIAWLFCYIIVFAVKAIYENRFFELKCQIRIATISTLLAAWKTEYAYLIFVVVLIDVIGLLAHKCDWKIVTSTIVFFVCGIIILSIPVKIANVQDNYKMTSVLTGLSYVLVERGDEIVHNASLVDDYNTINDITPIEVITQTYKEVNLPTAYSGWPPVSKKDQIKWLKSAVKICMHYPADFLKNRIYVYKYTNGMVQNVINHTGYEGPHLVLDMFYSTDMTVATFFTDHFKMTESPLGKELRIKVISTLACRDFDDYYKTNFLYKIMYNSLIPSFILLIAMFWCIIKKDAKTVLVIVTIFCIEVINFLLAPAIFWMYYMPFYLAAYTFITILVLLGVENYIGKDKINAV